MLSHPATAGVMIKAEHIDLVITHSTEVSWISRRVGIMLFLARALLARYDYQDAASPRTIMVTALGGSARGSFYGRVES